MRSWGYLGHTVADGCGLALGKLGWVTASSLSVPHKLLLQSAGHPLPLGFSATQCDAVPCQVECSCGGVSSSLPGLGRGHGLQWRRCRGCQGLAPWWKMPAWLILESIWVGHAGGSGLSLLHPSIYSSSSSHLVPSRGCGSQVWGLILTHPCVWQWGHGQGEVPALGSLFMIQTMGAHLSSAGGAVTLGPQHDLVCFLCPLPLPHKPQRLLWAFVQVVAPLCLVSHLATRWTDTTPTAPQL